MVDILAIAGGGWPVWVSDWLRKRRLTGSEHFSLPVIVLTG